MKLGDGPVRAIRDTFALCREHRIPVMLVRMPEGSTFPRSTRTPLRRARSFRE